MSASPSVVLIAAPSAVVSKLKGGLDERVEVIAAETYDDAVACVGERHVDLLVVCYVFDNVRPYRLLNQLQDLNKLPVSMLVRALPIPLREEEQEVRRAYASLGVSEFQNFSDQERSHGVQAALTRFRSLVFGLLQRRA
jgi:response regulator RpfG family c-di-GMP phosphodiesterase